MLNRTYKSLYEKIETPDYLIALTKEKMKKEQAKKHFSFYKYGTIAACFIIAIVVAIPYTKMSNNIDSIGNAPIQSATDSVNSLSGIATESYTKSNAFSEANTSKDMINFGSFDSTSSIAATEGTNNTSLINSFINFIKDIIQNIISFFVP